MLLQVSILHCYAADAARNKLSVDVGDCVRVPDKSDVSWHIV